jgi:hypothetical protein
MRNVSGWRYLRRPGDDHIEYWAAATIKERAVAAVEKELVG